MYVCGRYVCVSVCVCVCVCLSGCVCEREREIKREHARGGETRNKGTLQGDNMRMGIISVYWTRKYNSGSVSALALFFKT